MMSLYPIVPNAIVPSIARIDILRLLFDLMAYSLQSKLCRGIDQGTACLVMLSRGPRRVQGSVERGIRSAELGAGHPGRTSQDFFSEESFMGAIVVAQKQ